MKKIILIFGFISLLMSCKTDKNKESYLDEDLNVSTTIYPENLAKIFDAHGGIDAWNAFGGLYFEIEKPDQNEKYTVNLISRKSIIEYEYHLLGFDGSKVWLKDLDTVTYTKNPRFYYNLMFYFYAMPYVLGDEGINYTKVENLEFEGKSYPGILISYESGIGESPEDEYVLYYDPETHKMAWLGYTVTYFSKEKGKEFHFIKYAEWQTISGLELPKELHWYNYENNQPTTYRNTVNFTNVKLSPELPDDQIFEVAEGSTIFE